MNLDLPLISPVSRKYYGYASEKGSKIHHRAEDIRICLEYICDEMVIELVPSQEKLKWNNYKLDGKIRAVRLFMDSSIVDRLLRAKVIGNMGVHEGEEGNYNDTDIEESIEAIKQFSLELFLSYFNKNGFGDLVNGSWVPTVFSTLPPIYRVEILKKYHTTHPSVFVIDKLSKAYLKSDLEKEALVFLNNCLERKEINQEQYSILKYDLKLLKRDLHNFRIADNLEKAKENFNRLLPAIDESERDTFVCLVSMILTGKFELK